MAPLEELVRDPSQSQGRLIGSGREVTGDLFLRDWGKRAWGEGGGVRRIGRGNRLRNDGKEA